MKKDILFVQLISIMILAVLFTGCSTSSLTMDVLIPGSIKVDQDVQKVGIINRSLPSEDRKFENVLEGIFTGESIKADKEASINCMRGLSNLLNDSPRFEARILEGVEIYGTGTRKFPPLLTWDKVNALCDEYEVDALISLETFDSDIHLSKGKYEKEKEKDGRKYTELRFTGDLSINVNAGWRIYCPEKQVIADDNLYNDNSHWDSEGESPEQVLGRLPSKRTALNESGWFAGEQYARRISPTWRTVTRQYYSKKTTELEKASRYVKTDNWEKANEIWNELLQHPDPKIAGQAAYNLALFHEMKGNLDVAIIWAKKSYEEYGNKKALNYLGTLKKRKYDQYVLIDQLE